MNLVVVGYIPQHYYSSSHEMTPKATISCGLNTTGRRTKTYIDAVDLTEDRSPTKTNRWS
jgi:hypothetical protein